MRPLTPHAGGASTRPRTREGSQGRPATPRTPCAPPTGPRAQRGVRGRVRRSDPIPGLHRALIRPSGASATITSTRANAAIPSPAYWKFDRITPASTAPAAAHRLISESLRPCRRVRSSGATRLGEQRGSGDRRRAPAETEQDQRDHHTPRLIVREDREAERAAEQRLSEQHHPQPSPAVGEHAEHRRERVHPADVQRDRDADERETSAGVGAMPCAPCAMCERCTGVIAMTDAITTCEPATAKIAYRATTGRSTTGTAVAAAAAVASR